MARKQTDSYWSERAELREHEATSISEDSLKRLKREYDRIRNEMQKQTALLYMKYANENGLTIAEAKKRLTEKEKQDLRVSLEEYIEMFNGDSNEYAEMLDRISTRLRVGRLEALETQIDLLTDLLQERQINELGGMLPNVYSQSYYKKIFDIQQRAGYGRPFHNINIEAQNMMNSYINYIDPNKFSRRLWGSTGKMINEWKKIIEVGITTGASQYNLTKQLAERTNVAYNRVKTLVRTETSMIHGQATLDGYAQNEVEEYEFLATLDSVTTDICQKRDKKRYKVSEAEVGINYPPLHYNCRSTTIEVLPKWLEDIVRDGTETRAARGEDGNTYKVPADMNYDEWHDKYVVKNNEAQKILNKAKIVEPKITDTLKDIAKQAGTKLEGLEYRFKGLDSLVRKMQTTDAEIKDALRYTFVAEQGNYTQSYTQIVELLKAKGYNEIVMKNYWLNSNNPYNGINTNLLSPEGFLFEIQYHTPESFTLKNGLLHELYEKARILDEDSTEYAKLQDEMFKLSDALVKPKDLDKIRR
jgi:phage putative head morphogenesis protein, SPP1 gp7 family